MGQNTGVANSAAAGPQSAGPQAPQPLVLDSSENCESTARDLAQRGFKVVMRYYAWQDEGQAPSGKRLTQSEAAEIHAKGMAIGLVYEYGKTADDFSEAAANKAADYCLRRDAGLHPGKPHVIKHPRGTVIYFAVDTDELNGEIGKIEAYFKTIKDRFTAVNAPFELGVYGSGFMCRRLRASAAHVNFFWLPGVSSGWRDTRDFYKDPQAGWNLFQNVLEVPFAFQNAHETARKISVDTDLVNPRVGGRIGAFDAGGLIGGLDDSAIQANLRFIKGGSPTATFCKTPNGERITHLVDRYDSHGNVIGTDTRDYVEARKMVSVLEPAQPGQDWSKIEVNFVYRNVGSPRQGYVRSDKLATIEQYPD